MQDPQALWEPSPNFWPDRSGNVPQWIILHGTAGPGAVSWLQNPVSQVSAHYVITVDGVIHQLVDETAAAWGNGVITGQAGDSSIGFHDVWWDNGINPNLLTISIEHEKLDKDNLSDLTPAQKQASFALQQRICQRWNIPMRFADANGGVTGHYSIDPVNRSRCPGTYPWKDLWTYLKGQDNNMLGVPSGWKDDGKILTAPNNVQVRDGFRDFVLANHWDAGNLPVIIEQALNPLEVSNPILGPGTQQLFRMCVLEWTADRGVFYAYVGPEILALRQMIIAFGQNITQLKAQNATLAQQLQQSNTNAITALRQIAALVKPFEV